MKVGFLLIAAAAVAAPLSSANAQVLTLEERDAIYQQCYELYLTIPGKTENDANAYCYPRAYGNEVTGGGPSEGGPALYPPANGGGSRIN